MGGEELARHFQRAFRENPVGALRDWYRAQDALREQGEAPAAARLADELWEMREELPFPSDLERARFHHNAGVFFGSPGPAQSLERARACFAIALDLFGDAEKGWQARARHNLATALSNLGGARELEEAVGLFSQALEWRTEEQEIARGVTLHHLGIAWRRLSELDPGRAPEALRESVRAFEVAVEIRERLGLREGRALSLFHLAVSLEALSERGLGPREPAAEAFELAAEAFTETGRIDSAELARSKAARLS